MFANRNELCREQIPTGSWKEGKTNSQLFKFVSKWRHKHSECEPALFVNYEESLSLQIQKKVVLKRGEVLWIWYFSKSLSRKKRSGSQMCVTSFMDDPFCERHHLDFIDWRKKWRHRTIIMTSLMDLTEKPPHPRNAWPEAFDPWQREHRCNTVTSTRRANKT